MVALERRVNAVDSEVRQAKPVLVVDKPGKRGPRGKPGTLALLSPVPRDTICACSAYRVRHTPQCSACLPRTTVCHSASGWHNNALCGCCAQTRIRLCSQVRRASRCVARLASAASPAARSPGHPGRRARAAIQHSGSRVRPAQPVQTERGCPAPPASPVCLVHRVHPELACPVGDPLCPQHTAALPGVRLSPTPPCTSTIRRRLTTLLSAASGVLGFH